MSSTTKEMIQLVECLPEAEQTLIVELIKRIYLAWDPDFIKVTAAEKASIEESEAAFLRGEFIRAEDL